MLSSDEALARLQEGNARYAGETAERPNQTAARRAEVATSQSPFAAVIGCSDSRVPVEIVFDVGVGDIFVVRTAGNFVEDVCIASVEFAVANLGVPVVMVMGHRRCGAIKAAVDATVNAKGTTSLEHDSESNRSRSCIENLVFKLQPAVEQVRQAGGDLLDNAIRENVHIMIDRLKERSVIINDAVKTGKIRLVGSVYDLDTGRVMLEQ